MTRNKSGNSDDDNDQRSGGDEASENVIRTWVYAFGNAIAEEVGSQENEDYADNGKSQLAKCCNEVEQKALPPLCVYKNFFSHNIVQRETNFLRWVSRIDCSFRIAFFTLRLQLHLLRHLTNFVVTEKMFCCYNSAEKLIEHNVHLRLKIRYFLSMQLEVATMSECFWTFVYTERTHYCWKGHGYFYKPWVVNVLN